MEAVPEKSFKKRQDNLGALSLVFSNFLVQNVVGRNFFLEGFAGWEKGGMLCGLWIHRDVIPPQATLL